MNNNLKTALDELYNDESAKFQIGDHVEFSPEFEKKMAKLLPKKKPKISIKKHAFKIVMISAAAAAVFGISLTAGAEIKRGFTVKENYDKFWKVSVVEFTAPTDDNSPKTIEKIYTPTVFPEGKNYDHSAEVSENNDYFYASYTTTSEDIYDQPFWFDRDFRYFQYTRERFFGRVENNPNTEIIETKVNDCPAYLVTDEHYYGYDNALYWDHGDYIFYMWGNISGDELIRIAESFDVNEIKEG